MKFPKSIFSSKNVKTSAIYYFGNFFLSVFRYFFHLILLRYLTTAEYGEFLSYLSLMYVLAVPTGTVSSLVTKFVAEFKGKNDLYSINAFFYYLIRVTSPITFLLGVVLVLFSSFFASIFKAHQIAFVVLGLSTFVSLIQVISTSYLSALQKFKFQTISGFIGSIFTIILSVVLIEFGFGATGAVISQILASLLLTVLALINIRKYIFPQSLNTKKIKFSLVGFTGASFIFALGSMSLVSVDVLMVRILFDTATSGIYATLSILGRMILYGLMPFVTFMLPVATLKHSSGQGTKRLFIKLGTVMLFFAIIGWGIFTVFPEYIVKILASTSSPEIIKYLSVFSLAMVLFAFNQFFLSYLMATNRSSANYFLLAAVILQPVLIYVLRHSFSLVIFSNLLLQVSLCLSLIIFILYPYLYTVKFSHGLNKKA